MRGLTGCPDVDVAPSTARRWRHYGWLKAKWGSMQPFLPLAGGDTTAGIKAKWGSMQTDCPEIAGGRWQFGLVRSRSSLVQVAVVGVALQGRCALIPWRCRLCRGSIALAPSSSSFEFVGVVRPFAASLKSSREGFVAAGFVAPRFVEFRFFAPVLRRCCRPNIVVEKALSWNRCSPPIGEFRNLSSAFVVGNRGVSWNRCAPPICAFRNLG